MAVDELKDKLVATEEQKKESAGRVSRRSFLSGLGAAGIAVGATPLIGGAATAVAEAPAAQEPAAVAGAVAVTLKVNGKEHAMKLDPRTTLLDCLRENLDLPGTKKGCDHGQCGACTVHVAGRRVVSCLTLARQVEGRAVTTIEGLASTEGSLHPMQQAFLDHDALQCGYCTPGQIMSAIACVKEGHAHTAEDIREYMSGNLCRCGAYVGIVAAIEQVVAQERAV